MTELTTLQKALVAIKKLKQNEAARASQASLPIAIIGMSCRFPEVNSLKDYWQLLLQGKSVVTQCPEERWTLLHNTAEMELRKESHSYWGGYLNNITGFDAYYFGISPREALRMDPQQRILLEVVYEALEDAGLSMESLKGSNTGVFTSLYASQYAHLQQLDSDLDALYLPTGNASSIAANRISYLLDLVGPSMILDTACSSSLVAIHTAVTQIRQQLCAQAIVCGVNINLLPSINEILAQAKMLSPEGKCKTFSADADGYAQGEGAGAIILKPLNRALLDNDRIYAVIAGSAINQDGKTNGLTAPNGLQQERLLKDAYTKININPKHVSYVECHGTGTFLGDPIEIQALGEVLGKDRGADSPCFIASVKTNIGHLEPAAGIASIIKAALSLYHEKIPAHLNVTSLNPHIDFERYHFKIPQQVENYPLYATPNTVGVSGFGFGGTNAHVILQQQKKESALEGSPHQNELFLLSAKNKETLYLYINKWVDYIKSGVTLNLSQICYNLQVKRTHYFYRLAIIASSIDDLFESLTSIQQGEALAARKIYMTSEQGKGMVDSADSVHHLLDPLSLATSYVSGALIKWSIIEGERRYAYCDMPLYPWQHKDYWPAFTDAKLKGVNKKSVYPLRGRKIASPLKALQFEFKLDNKTMPDLKDTFNVLHAGYYMEMLAFVVQHINGKPIFTVTDHFFMSPLFILEDVIVTVQITLNTKDNLHYEYEIASHHNEQTNWVSHAKGNLILTPLIATTVESINSIRDRLPKNESANELYQQVVAMGMPAGDSIRWTHQYWLGTAEILSEFKQPESTLNTNSIYTLKFHPGIIDAAIQPLFKLLPSNSLKPYIASHVESASFFDSQPGPYYLYGRLKNAGMAESDMLGDCYLLNDNNKLIAAFLGIRLTQLNRQIDMQRVTDTQSQLQKININSLPLEERQVYLHQFLKEQLANIFSMPIKDIDMHVSLKDMGIDSLMALVFMRTLESHLGIQYTLQALLEGPTLFQITDYILKSTSSIPNKPSTPWLPHREKNAKPKMRLFCFPYGGGGASTYRYWQADFSADIEICPVQMPGREERMNEMPINKLDQLINALIEHLSPELDLPFAFFGHSFGALIAFELTRELRKRHLPQPMHLFASAFPDPRLPTKNLNTMLKQLSAANIDLFAPNISEVIEELNPEMLSTLSTIFNENGLCAYGDHLKNKVICQALLPIFSGDIGIVNSYQFYESAPLTMPITVFAGKLDTWVSYDDHFEWKDHTNKQFTIHSFESGHLFIKEEEIKLEVIQKVQDALFA